MAYIPEILNYKPFYIQTDADSEAIDTTEWGLVAKANPYPLLPTPKQPYKNEWLDEDGDDEYNAQMHYEAIEFDVSFYIKTFDEQLIAPMSIPNDVQIQPNLHKFTAEGKMRTQIEAFFAKIKNGEFMIYDSYTGIGRRGVRYAGYKEDSYKRRDSFPNGWARAVFTVTFKVNDPITRIIPINGKLREEI